MKLEKIVVASGNEGKIAEIKAIFTDVEIVSMRDLGFTEEIEETGKEDTEIMRVEDELVLRQALIGISPEQREVVILRIQGGFKYTEIAKMLGCNLSTVKSRYFQGIQKLNRLLKEGMVSHEKN